jgi:thiamine biosynthesis protein ThiC
VEVKEMEGIWEMIGKGHVVVQRIQKENNKCILCSQEEPYPYSFPLVTVISPGTP